MLSMNHSVSNYRIRYWIIIIIELNLGVETLVPLVASTLAAHLGI